MELPVHWELKSFNDFTLRELYEVLQMRTEVFVIGQDCVYQDMDGEDDKAIHLLGIVDNRLAAYCRIFPPNIIVKDRCNFGRVAVSNDRRGFGLGRALMSETLKYLRQQWPDGSTLIHAQLYLKDFYTSLGFQQCSEVYDEVGIPHIHMTLSHKAKT